MVEIRSTQVYNLKEAVVASGNAMRTELTPVNDDTFEVSLGRCKKLASNGGGTGHTNFRTGILVSFDLKYPQYFTKQLQRYHFIQYVSSTSMMHRITKMDFSKCCNKYVSKGTIRLMKNLIEIYNKLSFAKDKLEFFTVVQNKYLPFLEEEYSQGYNPFHDDTSREDVLYDCFMRIMSNCPMGAELWGHCTTNYEQLATIYKQRKNHKLKEDWGEFCKWIECLPYAKELIVCESNQS